MLEPKTTLAADPAAIRADLAYMTADWHELPGRPMFEVRAIREGNTPQTVKYDVADIDVAVEFITQMNAMGCNIYAVRNPIKPGTKGSASDGDIMAARFLWADCDDPAAAGNVQRFDGPKWTASVITGKTPHTRAHTYWKLEDWCYDLGEWRAMQTTIAAHFASDSTVVNPSRIMRVAGTVTYPFAHKRAKGYVSEIAALKTQYSDQRDPVTLDQMARVFGASAPARPSLSQQAASRVTAPPGSFQIDTGADFAPSLDRDATIDAILRGENWHLNMVKAVGSYVARGWIDREIHSVTDGWTLPGYTLDDTRREVQAAIDGARRKGFTPPEPIAPQVQEMQAQAEAAEVAEWPTLYDFFDEAALAPRQWVYGKHYLRRFVSVLASAGGIGKTSMQIVEALAICTGKPLLGEEVKEQCNVWIINLEDPMDEMQRRILAAMRHYNITPDELRGRLFVDAGRDFTLTFAVQTREGVTPNTALVDHLIKKIPERGIGAVFIDPFVGAHLINENDNMAVNAVVGQIRRVADETNCAIGLVHHIRKGNGEDATIDSVRGAGSLIGAARAARVINRVSEDDAIKLGVNPREALGIFRVDDGKANLAPPAANAVFRRMEGVQIANGEWVGVATSYALPDEWEGMNDDATNDILRIITMGIPDQDGNEEYYSARPQDTERWAGNVIVNYAFDNPDNAKNAGQAKRIIGQWIKSGQLEEFEYRSAKQRKDRKGLRSTGRVGAQT